MHRQSTARHKLTQQDMTPAALAARFARRALELGREGRECAATARLAFSYAAIAQAVCPDCRGTGALERDTDSGPILSICGESAVRS